MKKEDHIKITKFKDKLVFNGNWNCPELFKLEFKNNNLISIENVME